MYELLRGIRVVEVAEWVLVPTAAAVLADWGADVIKVEHPETGDPMRGLASRANAPGGVDASSPLLTLSNRGKRDIGIDISTPAGLEILLKLVDTADVFMTSLRSRAQKKLGISPDDIRGRNPRIIYAHGTAWGQRGERAGRPGFDLAQAWAGGGIAHQMMNPSDEEPPMMPSSIGDLTGALVLAGGIGTALYQRERTGVGQEVTTSLYHLGMWITSQMVTTAPLGVAPPPGLRRRDQPNPLVNCYETKDGRWFWLVLLQADRYWKDFCQGVGLPDLVEDPRFIDIQHRAANKLELMSIFDSTFAAGTLREWSEVFDSLDIPWSPVMSPLEISSDSHAIENGYLPEAISGDGSRIRVVASPWQFGGDLLGDLSAAPEHGQHTEDLLLELGYSWDQIGALKESACIN